LVPGLSGAPLKPLSGILPPATTQDFNLHANQYAAPVAAAPNGAEAPKKLTDKLKLPFGLVGYFDLQEGLAASRKLNKPIMLDFTGHSCANCRKMEEEVWSNPRVLEKLRNNFVIVSLYVDERTEIATKQQYQGDDGVFVNTVGEWNLAYQIKKFGINSQPLYMFIDADEKILSTTKYGYNSNVDKFLAHLTTIENEYKKLHP
jgi:thioredoxin-related protein